jgi:hypothetical protein
MGMDPEVLLPNVANFQDTSVPVEYLAGGRIAVYPGFRILGYERPGRPRYALPTMVVIQNLEMWFDSLLSVHQSTREAVDSVDFTDSSIIGSYSVYIVVLC